ncbi:MAG: glycine cleavage system protein GcvH [Anaerolineales bacterium]|nr:glycine cleavage system protein GcvH [Anaerolineales bacterium]
MEFPSDLKYTATDEWIRAEGKKAVLGVTDYAQDQLSDIVFVEILVGPGDTLDKGKAIVTVESVKAAAEVYSPVSGKVGRVNDELAGNPEWINAEPFGKAWMIEFELSDPAELNGLMDASAYQQHCEERSH